MPWVSLITYKLNYGRVQKQVMDDNLGMHEELRMAELLFVFSSSYLPLGGK